MNIKNLIAVTVVLSTVVSAKADTLATRTNITEGAKASTDVMLFTKNLDVVVFGAGGKTPTIEVGHLWELSKGKHHLVLGGAYGSYWTGNNKAFVEPFLMASAWKGKTTATVKAFAYLPLNGGGTFTGVDEISLTQKVSSQVSLGIEGTFFKSNPGSLQLKWGPTLRWKGVSARYLPFGEGPDKIRVVMSHSF